MLFGFWNVRGIMDPVRRAEVRKLVAVNKLSLIGLFETKVPEQLFDSISSSILRGWRWTANYDYAPRGRIWIGWNPTSVDFDVISRNDQAIHGRLNMSSSNFSCCVSAIYGEHTFVRRRPLWDDLIFCDELFQDTAWLVSGDFNAIKDPSDRFGGSNAWIPCFDEFKLCLDQTELEDLRYSGLRFTWSTSVGEARKMRKIDRVLVNSKWRMDFSYSEASFLNPGISYHTPMVVRVVDPQPKRKPFKFFDFLVDHPDFQSTISHAWNSQVWGVPMFRLVSKLKVVKARLKDLNMEAFSDISQRTLQARENLRSTQMLLQSDPENIPLAELERGQRSAFIDLRRQEESFYKQKSRIRWLKEGDRNTRFFHNYVKARCLNNQILSVKDSASVVVSDPVLVPKVFLSFFTDLLTPRVNVAKPDLQELTSIIPRPLTEGQVCSLASPVSDLEVDNTLFSLAEGKAPGPDGFTVEFFKNN